MILCYRCNTDYMHLEGCCYCRFDITPDIECLSNCANEPTSVCCRYTILEFGYTQQRSLYTKELSLTLIDTLLMF